jgi:hypothetical protein
MSPISCSCCTARNGGRPQRGCCSAARRRALAWRRNRPRRHLLSCSPGCSLCEAAPRSSSRRLLTALQYHAHLGAAIIVGQEQLLRVHEALTRDPWSNPSRAMIVPLSADLGGSLAHGPDTWSPDLVSHIGTWCGPAAPGPLGLGTVTDGRPLPPPLPPAKMGRPNGDRAEEFIRLTPCTYLRTPARCSPRPRPLGSPVSAVRSRPARRRRARARSQSHCVGRSPVGRARHAGRASPARSALWPLGALCSVLVTRVSREESE